MFSLQPIINWAKAVGVHSCPMACKSYVSCRKERKNRSSSEWRGFAASFFVLHFRPIPEEKLLED